MWVFSLSNATIVTKDECIFIKIRGSTFSRVNQRMAGVSIAVFLSLFPGVLPRMSVGRFVLTVRDEQEEDEETVTSSDDLASSVASLEDGDAAKGGDDDLVSTARGLESLNDPLREALETQCVSAFSIVLAATHLPCRVPSRCSLPAQA